MAWCLLPELLLVSEEEIKTQELRTEGGESAVLPSLARILKSDIHWERRVKLLLEKERQNRLGR